MFKIIGGSLVLLSFIIFSPLSYGSDRFEEAFRKYLELRTLEHQFDLMEYRADLDAQTRHEEQERFRRSIQDKRTELQSLAHSALDGTSAWQRIALNRATGTSRNPASAPLEKSALDYLFHHYPSPTRLSSLEWLAISEWFGTRTQEAFLKSSFAIQEARIAAARDQADIIWIKAPFQELAVDSNDVFRPYHRWLRASEKTRGFVKASGIPTHFLDLSAFTKLDEQAEELYRLLKNRKHDGKLIVTTGEASAIMHRAVDLHPEMREWKLAGWLNFNGRIYGFPAGKKTTANKGDPVREMEREALSELHRLHGETLLPPPPLGEGFPIVNLISLSGDARPAANLRESIVPEGRSYFLKDGNEPEAFRATALSLGRTPSATHKVDWKESLRIGDPSI